MRIQGAKSLGLEDPASYVVIQDTHSTFGHAEPTRRLANPVP